ncbi:MAG: hypothetical protein ACOX1S_09250 [Anaerostipes sp.]|jgi:hypothetical protein
MDTKKIKMWLLAVFFPLVLSGVIPTCKLLLAESNYYMNDTVGFLIKDFALNTLFVILFLFYLNWMKCRNLQVVCSNIIMILAAMIQTYMMYTGRMLVVHWVDYSYFVLQNILFSTSLILLLMLLINGKKK